MGSRWIILFDLEMLQFITYTACVLLAIPTIYQKIPLVPVVVLALCRLTHDMS